MTHKNNKKGIHWKMVYANVRGLKGKKASIIETLHDINPQVCFLTETQLRSNIGINIDGFCFYGRKREGKVGGGIGIYVRNDIITFTTPHISNRNIEIMWISVRRHSLTPLMLGVYYGRQESRTSKNEIEIEMALLTEEIEEMKREGEIILTMDGNAKVGILGETVNRNGRLLLDVFNKCNLVLMNTNAKCSGQITRQNTKNESEKSAIDFVLASHGAEPWITGMVIDEEGIHKIKGKNETDHSTICIDIKISGIEKLKTVKKTDWNLRASSEKWAAFGDLLEESAYTASCIITDLTIPFITRYKQWYKVLDNAARNSIGKTTFKMGGKEKFSTCVKEMRQHKVELRQRLKTNDDETTRNELLSEIKSIQEKITTQIIKERENIIHSKFQKIISDPSKNSLWKEKKKMSRDTVLEALTIKDVNGNRQYDPESIKEHSALYYEDLYRGKQYPSHPYHQTVNNDIEIYSTDMEHEQLPHNQVPLESEIISIIENKSNGKSTTDIKNEMLKRPGNKMSQFLYPMFMSVWHEEKIPDHWNMGQITSIWKGKGDKEDLKNHRGITTSSAIGSICEALIDNRLEAVIPFTQAQGGGKRGASTVDHLFIMRAVIEISKKQKRPTFLTFYDVSKAYDHANVDDMLNIVWDRGLKGKVWRILKNMSKNLKASIKTKHGKTREIEMEIGGRQGSRLTGRLFSKMMDVLAEELLDEGFHMTDIFRIAILLWVDDVVTFTESEEEQVRILETVNQFALKHKIQWGREKCKVMRVGHHRHIEAKTWKIGSMPIEECASYKYLGDQVTSDGKNGKNIEERKNKIITSTMTIKAIAAGEVLIISPRENRNTCPT